MLGTGVSVHGNGKGRRMTQGELFAGAGVAADAAAAVGGSTGGGADVAVPPVQREPREQGEAGADAAALEAGADAAALEAGADAAALEAGADAAALEAGLRRLGLVRFRPGQRAAIRTLLATGRLLLVAPTGGGKSLTYQLPATLLPGTTVVVSPLIALMHDQVAALAARGIAATYLAATLPPDEVRRRVAGLTAGAYKLVYVAPERLASDRLRSTLAHVTCPLVAIDEAHCISAWGHDFRPDYLQLHELLQLLPRARVLACTATATPVVRDEILERLGLPADTPQLIHGFARPNLALRVAEVTSKAERTRRIDGVLMESLGRPGAAGPDGIGAGGGYGARAEAGAAGAGNASAAADYAAGTAGTPGAGGDCGASADPGAAGAGPAGPAGAAGTSGTAIVYAPTRREAEAEAGRLSGRGWTAAAYHAGMDGSRRDRVQGAFSAGRLQVVVATNAFGMGIDRPDVRCVAHLAPPGSLEAYYQEAGRAGRDGQPAVCLLLISPGDMGLRRRLIERDGDGATDPELVGHKWQMFLELMRWAEGGACRHDAILRYFGDEEETLAGCGRCDVCLQLAQTELRDDEHATDLVRKALCGVARVHHRFGLAAAVKLLKGAPDERLCRTGLDGTPTFGVLARYPEEWLLRLLRRCVTAGWVDFTGGDRPLAVLTPEGRAVIDARRPARLLLPRLTRTRPPSPGGGRARMAAPALAAAAGELDHAGRTLFEALRAFRIAQARHQQVPPYVIASDRTLRDIAVLRPTTVTDLEFAHGIGPAKAQRYGPEILAIVRRHVSTHSAAEHPSAAVNPA